MRAPHLYLGIVTLGVIIAPIISLPQDISFGGKRQVSFGGQKDDGNVRVKSGCTEFCTANYEPVCGTNGETYSNKCELERKACQTENDNLAVNYQGECGKKSEGSGNREDESDVKPRQNGQQNCCCMHVSSSCPNPFSPKPNNGNGGSNAFLSAASPRFGPEEEEEEEVEDNIFIGSRIVNKPPRPTEISQNQVQQEFYCEANERACCYNSGSTLNNVINQSRCITRSRPTSRNVYWEQRCASTEPRNIRQGEKRCGERRFRDISGKKPGQANPAEFPWACLVLDQNNNFIGSCAIIPDNRFNDVRSGTDRVIMAAHKLKELNPRNNQLKIRVIEYDASGFKNTENTRHQEYQVGKYKGKYWQIHPSYNPDRLSYDLAVLKVETTSDGFGGIKGRIDLSSTDDINAACLPGCNNMFDFEFTNGTGVRCWVAGWGKDGNSGQFQIIQNKVDVPLMDSTRRGECEAKLKRALGSNAGRDFELSASEVCAGGEEGKDACDGDGGAPLVCQSKDNRWTVVGLVTWGVDCAKRGVPGVYANVHHMMDFILSA